jgi:hypothetical protein
MKSKTALIAALPGALLPGILFSAPVRADEPKWSLVCDSDKGCRYWSDGLGKKKQECDFNSGNKKADPACYPPNMKKETVLVEVEQVSTDGAAEADCVWQWRYIGGSWYWVCVKK